MNSVTLPDHPNVLNVNAPTSMWNVINSNGYLCMTNPIIKRVICAVTVKSQRADLIVVEI